jgi:ERCC4-type nuclease
MSEPTRKILVDDREPPDLTARIKNLGIVVEIAHLDIADYVIGNILVERKTIDDLLTSMSSGRLWNQLFNMKNSGMKGILAVVGDFPYSLRNVENFTLSKVNLLNRIASLKIVCYLSYGVLLVHLPTVKDFIDLMSNIWRRANCESVAPVLKKFDDPIQIKASMLSAVPGIGGKASEYLAKNYLLLQLMNLTEEQISEIKINDRRIGKRAKKIKEVFSS